MTRLALFTLAGVVALLIAASAALATYQFQTSWGQPGAAAGQFSGPVYVAVGPDGSVYVSDTGNQRVQKFTADGAFQTAWGQAGTANGQFSNPSGIAVGPDGSVYVVDKSNNRVQRFDANGNFVSTWGTPGSGDGQFNSPEDVAVGPDGSVYVSDNANSRVEHFLADGTFLNSITSGAGGFGAMAGVAVGPDGSLYVVDQTNHRVEHFDASGVPQAPWGSNGTGDGQFQQPTGIAASAAGVYVADSAQNRVQKFTSSGAFVDALDAAGSGDAALSSPTGVAISSTGVIYVLGANRVSSYNETGSASLPPPQTGETANAQPVNGTVKIKQPGSDQFVTLTDPSQIKIGSIIDVTNGTIDLTTTATQNTTQTARFYAGVFKLTQPKAAKPVTELQLFGGNFTKLCGKAGKSVATAARKKVVRQLWGAGKGSFRTKGKYASASIRGTQWLTQDRCDGTLVRVTQGSVAVRNLVTKTNAVVSAPSSLFVPAKKR